MRILDLCCGAGGAAMGLHQAFPDAEIVGVDIRPQPRYPFTFVQDDALKFDLTGFDFVWASPPCQHYTQGRRQQRAAGDNPYPDLVGLVRQRLQHWGGPWLLENVVGAPVKTLVILCGDMFGLRVFRHRLFEAPFLMFQPEHRKHESTLLEGYFVPVYRKKWTASGGSGIKGKLPLESGRIDTWKTAMGIDWMTTDELAEAIPPAYSRYLAQFIPLPVERVA